MNQPSYFVLVFGDPNRNGDTVESGRYEAEKGYPPFEVEPGDLLLLYCTEGYEGYPKQLPGIGVALSGETALVEYRWIPFSAPIKRDVIEQTFDLADYTKMRELGIKARRAFIISRTSFAKTVANRPLSSAL
jgi:hypothetical protein